MKKYLVMALIAAIVAAAMLIPVTLLLPAALAESEAAATIPIDLTGLFNAVIAVLGALVTYRLVPWLKARTTKEQQEMLQAGIRTAVYAAEQLYKTGMVQDRLDYALRWLDMKGYSVDRAQVEAAVREMQENQLQFQELTVETGAAEVTDDGDA